MTDNVIAFDQKRRSRRGNPVADERLLEDLYGPRDLRAPFGAPGVHGHHAEYRTPPAPKRPIR